MLGSARRGEASAPDQLHTIDLIVDGEPRVARRALLLVPGQGVQPRSLLVLLHGLGETGNELLGIHAWSDRYGLVRAYERLRAPPITALDERLGYLEAARARELNAALAQRPFQGFALLCPVTPNPHRSGRPEQVLDTYASWLAESLLPEAAARLAVSSGSLAIGLDGCSLGGYVGLEVFLRRPDLFRSFGVVQPAIGVVSAQRYARQVAEALAKSGPVPIHIETSSLDPYRKASRQLSEALGDLAVPSEFRMAPGPHSQPWLREVGTLEMLLWHDRQLNHGAA